MSLSGLYKSRILASASSQLCRPCYRRYLQSSAHKRASERHGDDKLSSNVNGEVHNDATSESRPEKPQGLSAGQAPRASNEAQHSPSQESKTSIQRADRNQQAMKPRTLKWTVERKRDHAAKHQSDEELEKMYPSPKPFDNGRIKLEPYTKEEWARLKEKYTPEQILAIRAAESAIDPEDIARGAIRNDVYSLDYIDDLAEIEPTIDFMESPPPTDARDLGKGAQRRKSNKRNEVSTVRFKSEDEVKQEFAKLVARSPESATSVQYKAVIDKLHRAVPHYSREDRKRKADRRKRGEGEEPFSLLQQPVPKGLPSLEAGRVKTDEEDLPDHFKKLMRQTGMNKNEIRSLRIKALVRHRVVNQTRLGKIESMYILTIAGNERGLLGVGEGKSAESIDAIRQAQYAAIRNMKPVPRYENRTIFGTVKGKCGAVELELQHRPPGYGLRCQHLVYEMCRCAGITDISARRTRARNPMNTVKATFKALMSQRTPEDMARGLGRKLVDVRKVYYGGTVT